MTKMEKACLRIAHRGASAHAVENTAPALKKALKQKADMVEMDVRRCKSGEVILFHDRTLRRLARDRRRVADMTLMEIRKVFPEVITLEEALNILRGRAQVYIEIKDRGMADAVTKIIRAHVSSCGWRKKDFLIASHFVGELREARTLFPEIPRALIVNGYSTGHAQYLARLSYRKWRLARELEVSALSFSKWLLRKKYVRQSRDRGYKVFVWTVNRRKNIDRMKKWGVDGIISDYPERV